MNNPEYEGLAQGYVCVCVGFLCPLHIVTDAVPSRSKPKPLVSSERRPPCYYAMQYVLCLPHPYAQPILPLPHLILKLISITSLPQMFPYSLMQIIASPTLTEDYGEVGVPAAAAAATTASATSRDRTSPSSTGVGVTSSDQAFESCAAS